ncbi:MAG: branched-chain amino acid ABC transporter permease [Desulfobulbaceae bacterium]|jgi:branched-chain amino acid transport system permease protein|nr:branched-chain amino acid ABC transporter permease [Desulfobulbaceae bacterium]
MDYLLHIGVMVNIYILLALAANLPAGMTGLLSLCQAAFYGLGTYLAALWLLPWQLPIIFIAVLVMLFGGVVSLLISYASLKLKGDYFILATLGFQMLVFTILYNWTDVTHGPYGVAGIVGVQIFGWGLGKLSSVAAYFLVSAFFVGMVVCLFLHLRHSPFGRLMKAVRDDEIAVQALGRNPDRVKFHSFFLSAAFSALAGLLYASYIGYIDPTSFTLDESIFILCALFIGGVGNVKGPVAGAVFVIILPEILRFIGLPDAQAANLRQIIYGLALILAMYFRPQGICGEKGVLRL